MYRALANLKRDGLLRSCEAVPAAGSTRQVYTVTEDGHAALAAWMAAVDEEKSLLTAVLKRYDVILDGLAGDDADLE